MPRFDGTGPNGNGPMTGGGRGLCVNRVSNASGFSKGQRVFGAGRGMRGFRNCFYATGLTGRMRSGYGYPMEQVGFTAEDEAEVLKEQMGFFKQQLENIQHRINELDLQKKK